MKVLLDTNVITEATARYPSAVVMAWIAALPLDMIHLSAVTIGEVAFGIAKLPPGAKRDRLSTWRDHLIRRTGRRILSVDIAVASAWGEIRARAVAEKRPMAPIDALIAATAQVHGLTVVTRNVADFEVWQGSVFNPWPATA